MHSSIHRLAVIAALASLGVAACETTAYIVPENKSLSFVDVVGTVPTTCDPLTPELAHDLRFSAISSDNERIRPGDELVGFTVTLGETFSVSNTEVTLSEGRLYPVPDVACTTAADCQAAGLPADFVCEDIDETGSANVSNPTVCSRELNVQVDANNPLGYSLDDSNETEDRHVLMLMANGATLLGRNPITGGTVNVAASSDQGNVRLTGVNQFLTRLADPDEDNPYDVEFCFATFITDATFLNQGECFAELVAERGDPDFENLLNEINTVAARPDDGDLQTSNAMISAIARLAQQPSGDKHLVVFVDSPTVTQEARETMDLLGATYTRAAEQAAQAGVTIHVIQLDNPFQGQDSNGDGVFDPALGEVAPFWPRTGPIPELQQLACQTGGTFQYAQSPADLTGMFERLGAMLIEHYEVTVDYNQFGAPPFGSYAVSYNFEVTLNDRAESFALRAGIPEGQFRADRRAIFPFFGACDDTRPCHGLLTCNSTTGQCELPLIETLVAGGETEE